MMQRRKSRDIKHGLVNLDPSPEAALPSPSNAGASNICSCYISKSGNSGSRDEGETETVPDKGQSDRRGEVITTGINTKAPLWQPAAPLAGLDL